MANLKKLRALLSHFDLIISDYYTYIHDRTHTPQIIIKRYDKDFFHRFESEMQENLLLTNIDRKAYYETLQSSFKTRYSLLTRLISTSDEMGMDDPYKARMKNPYILILASYIRMFGLALGEPESDKYQNGKKQLTSPDWLIDVSEENIESKESLKKTYSHRVVIFAHEFKVKAKLEDPINDKPGWRKNGNNEGVSGDNRANKWYTTRPANKKKYKAPTTEEMHYIIELLEEYPTAQILALEEYQEALKN